MNVFEELGRIYSEIDTNYSTIELHSRASGYFRKEQRYQRKRELNDQAYFLFMFSRLEDRIKELSDSLLDFQFKNLTRWSTKRVWDILHKRKNSINFMDRVALLTRTGQANYNLIERYYQQRNNIAHGQSFSITVNILTVIEDMKRLYGALRKN